MPIRFQAGIPGLKLKPYDARLMRCYPVSTWINSVANDDEECFAPVIQSEKHLGAGEGGKN